MTKTRKCDLRICRVRNLRPLDNLRRNVSKTFVKLLVIGVLVVLSCHFELRAQTIQGASQVSVPSQTPYRIISQDANSRIWQSESYEAGQNGLIVTNIHSYKEVASGLNYLSNGVWAASEEQISILPNGTGAATNGQHKVYFPGDLSSGQIEMDTPDGKQIFSQPLELSYFDGTNTVVLAELTNSVGIIVGNNQVVYPNAFNGLKADIRYTYTCAGLEQDVIIKQQPLTPEFYGLNPGSARLQMVTEFFNSPNPDAALTTLPQQGGISLEDQSIGFGMMQMVPGRAFLLGQSATDPGAFVAKSWLSIVGRQFLVEEVPVNAIVEGLAALPLIAMNERTDKPVRLASRHRVMPRHRFEGKSASRITFAKNSLPKTGFLMDYLTVNGSLTNAIFQGDTTYFISGQAYLFGTNVFEGGAVIKYTNNAEIEILPGFGTPSTIFKTSSYLPVVFTAMDDNSFGDAISGSTGTPSGYYANPALYYAGAPSQTISNIRIEFARQGITGPGYTYTISDAQIMNCQNAINVSSSTVHLRNALMANNQTNFPNPSFSTAIVDAQNVTFSGCGWLASTNASFSSVSFAATNCLFVNVTNLSIGVTMLAGQNNGFYNDSTFGSAPTTAGSYPFQSAGAGNYYLPGGSSFKNAGTTNINASLLVDLASATTYPPLFYSNTTNYSTITLSPQAARDNVGAPDLGYHYNPIDYITDLFWITNSTLNLANGVVLAHCNEEGIVLTDGSFINSVGCPRYPNVLTGYQTVQEEPIIFGINTNPPSYGYAVAPTTQSSAPMGVFNFTKFTCLAGGGYHLYDFNNPQYSYASLLTENCEFWGGEELCEGYTGETAVFNNNLFARSFLNAIVTSGSTVAFTNNLFWGETSFTLVIRSAGAALAYAYNNDFDSCKIHVYPSSCTNGYNAYLNCTGQLNPTNSTDIFSTNGLAYQTSWFGSFYQPTNSILIQMGNTTANQVGLYHFTTQTNQIPETNAVVDIGYHYVATDQYGNPLDTNGDGLPDYVEDANGNGLVDSGETGWNLTNDLGLQVIISQPVNGSSIP